MSVDEIVAAAMELPEEQMNELLERLNARRPSSGASAAWIEEAERRMDLVRAGKMRLIDADEVLADPDEDA